LNFQLLAASLCRRCRRRSFLQIPLARFHFETSTWLPLPTHKAETTTAAAAAANKEEEAEEEWG
jgi:hypothetical protein